MWLGSIDTNTDDLPEKLPTKLTDECILILLCTIGHPLTGVAYFSNSFRELS